MLVILSDLHLSDGTAVDRNIHSRQVEDFWHNLNRQKKGLNPFSRKHETEIEIVFLGDFFDLLRSQQWERSPVKPWHPQSPEQKKVVEAICDGIFSRNHEALEIFRKFLGTTPVKGHYVIGNHDQLLLRYPDVFKKLHERLNLFFPEPFHPNHHYEKFFEHYGVFAHHGDRGDPWNDIRGVLHPIGDAMVTQIYNRFPKIASSLFSGGERLCRALEDIVFVRPYRLAPYWIIQATREYGEEKKVKQCWNQLVEEFLEVDFVRTWSSEMRKITRAFSPPSALKATLRVSSTLPFRGWLSVGRMVNAMGNLFALSPKKVRHIRQEFSEINMSGSDIKFLVKGHTHNPGVLSLGKIDSRDCTYINTGTWTRTLLPQRFGPMEPADDFIKSFVASDFISYAIFFRPEENPATDMEFWSGRLNPRG